jgi:DNA polymerase I-like protein with 3'-5' exonuclease and polymerase domains
MTEVDPRLADAQRAYRRWSHETVQMLAALEQSGLVVDGAEMGTLSQGLAAAVIKMSEGALEIAGLLFLE